MLYSSEHELVYRFIRGLAFSLHLALEHLIVARYAFSQVFYHTRANQRVCIEIYKQVVRGYVFSIVSLTFYQRVRILLVECSFTYSLSVLWRSHLRLWVALIIVQMVIVGRVLIKHSRVFDKGLQVIAAVLDQQGQCLRVFQELVVVKFVIGLESNPNVIWLVRWSQHVFLTSLLLLRYVMIARRMVILLRSAVSISWSANQLQLMFLVRLRLQGFATTAIRLVTGLESVSGRGLLIIHPIQIGLVEM